MGSWDGLMYLVGTIVIGMTVVAAVIWFAEYFDRKHAPILISGAVAGVVATASVLSSAKFNLLVLGGVPFVVAGGSMFWATISLGQDYLNEIYGREVAKASLWAGFLGWFAGTIMLVWLLFNVPTPPGELLDRAEKAKEVLGLVARVNIVAFLTYLVSSWLNIYLFDKIKTATGGKTGVYLWLRSTVSTAVAMAVDGLLFSFGSFLGMLPVAVIVNMVVANLVVKWATSAVEILWIQPLVNYKRRLAAGASDKTA